MSKKIVLSDNKRKLSLTWSAEIIAINVDLLAEILLRVPAISLIRFKFVSKQWLSLISDARFCRNHTQQNPSPPISGLYLYSNRDRITRVSFHDHPRTTLPNFSFLDGSGSGSETTVLHSSNGLMLCLCITGFYNYVVCNLTTRKFVVLPKLADVSKPHFRFRHYLIYDPKKSPYYKVVVVIVAYDGLGAFQFDVYSSESGSWKSTVAASRIPKPWWGHVALWNGSLFWMSCGPGPRSCSEHDHFYFEFDIVAERPTTTGVPSIRYYSNGILYFGECGGHLLLIHTDPWYDATEFMVLETMDGENKFRWTVKYRIYLQALTLQPRSTYRFSVMSVMNVGANENDLAVLLYVGGKVIQYNMECKTFLVLCELQPGGAIPKVYSYIESLTPV